MNNGRIEKVAALEEPTRRRILEFVRRANHPVSRDEVAKEAGISRKLAAFHLDRLLQLGFLRSHYARPPGRSGPGAGRSAKYYQPSDQEVELSIPPRRYDLAGELLMEAVRSEQPKERARDAALRVARSRGRKIGDEVRAERKFRRVGPERAMATASDILDQHGFLPYVAAPGVVALRNCPFHSLAQRAPDLMCSMNQAFIDGLLRGIGNDSVQATLECKPGDCCVTLRAPK